jgi:hypothetical protein
MKLEAYKSETIIEEFNKATNEISFYADMELSGEFFRCLMYISDRFVQNLQEEEEEFDLTNKIANLMYAVMKTGYNLNEKQMRVN